MRTLITLLTGVVTLLTGVVLSFHWSGPHAVVTESPPQRLTCVHNDGVFVSGAKPGEGKIVHDVFFDGIVMDIVWNGDVVTFKTAVGVKTTMHVPGHVCAIMDAPAK